MDDGQSSTVNRQSAAAPGCMAYGLFVVAILWICAVIAVSAPATWFAREVTVIGGAPWPLWVAPLLALIQALLIGVPIGLLAALTKSPLLRASYVTWAGACGWLVLYGLARALPASWEQPAALAQIVVGALALIVLQWQGRSRTGNAPWTTSVAGLVFAPIVVLPWLIFGALGSPLDTLLDGIAGVGVGLVAATLLDRFLPTLAAAPGGSWLRVGFGGLTLGVALIIIAAGAGFEASNLLVLAALPPLGFGAVALALPFAGQRRAWLGAAILVGSAAAAALASFDPDEITLLLGSNDIPTLALRAAGLGFLASMVVGFGLWAVHLAAQRLATPRALSGFVATAAASGMLYIILGHPGFYGERLFVILRDQADLSKAPAIADRDERLRFVYTTLTDHANSTQAGLRADLDRFGIGYQPYYLVNALEVDGGPLVRLWISSHPEVARVIDSPRLRPLVAPPTPEPGDRSAPTQTEWNITSIGADRVWRELEVTGAGIVIGQSDSGVDGTHPDLRDGYRGRVGGDAYNWIDPWYGSTEPYDYGMHGTHTLGSAAGRNGIGVAPGASWIGCVNLARNLGNPARYLDCMQFMLAPYAPGTNPLTAGNPALAAHVLNNSWGCPPIEGCDAASLEPAVLALRAAGIFVVASAGNEGSACSSVSDPIAIYGSVLSVGAIGRDGNVTDFSSRGPVTVDGSGRTKPDIVAPGADILSAQPGGTYGTADGTSMAGPHVVGVVALMWSANPRLIGDIDGTERILRTTAKPYRGSNALSCAGSGEVSNVAGYGIVDAYAAVKAALQAAP